MKQLIKRILNRILYGRIAEFCAEHLDPQLSDLRKLTVALADMTTIKAMPERALVSIIMPTHNRGFIIADAIRSVRDQEHTNWELIIVDDGSVDDTKDVVRRYLTDPRIKYIQLDTKGGVSKARNCALRHMSDSTEWVAYLDSDNTMTPHYLQTMLSNIPRDRKCAYSVTSVDNAYLLFKSFDYEKLKIGNYIDMNVFIHHVDLYRKLGGFDERLTRLVDWDLILRYTVRNVPAEVPVLGVKYRSGKWDRVSNTASFMENYRIIMEKLKCVI